MKLADMPNPLASKTYYPPPTTFETKLSSKKQSQGFAYPFPTEGSLPKLPGHPNFPYDRTGEEQPDTPTLVERTALKARTWLTYAFPGWSAGYMTESGKQSEE